MCWRGFLFDSSRRVSARGRRSIGSFDFPFPYATPAGARQMAQQQPAAFPASSKQAENVRCDPDASGGLSERSDAGREGAGR
jgi:hypothetical protein